MDLYKTLSSKPRQFLACTGMSLVQFQQHLPQLSACCQAQEVTRKQVVVQTGKPRRRLPGGGGQYAHDVPNRLLMLLLYYRLYLSQDFMTLLFNGCHKSSISRAIAMMRPVFESVLPTPERALNRILDLADKAQKHRRIGNLDEFRAHYPELTILIDGVEQPRQRSQDKKKQRDDYSGKKKRHTRKQIITTTPSGIIIDQSPSTGGRTHDFALFKRDQAERSPYNRFEGFRVTGYVDGGFQGIKDLNLPIDIKQVERARRNHPLTPYQKQINHLRSQKRIAVEHTISRRKKYRIADHTYRNHDDLYDKAMSIVAGLVNLRAYERIEKMTGLTI